MSEIHEREQVQVQYPPAAADGRQARDALLAIIARADQLMADVSSTTGLLDAMLGLMIETCQADSASFFKIDEASNELVITNVAGDMGSYYLVGLRFNRDQGLPGILFEDARVIVVGDLPSEPEWLRAVDPENALRKRNVINLPVTLQDRLLGVIQIYNFQQAELDLLSLLCRRLAAEIARQREVEDTRRYNQRLMTLLDIMGQVPGKLDRDTILRKVTQNASRLVGAERSSIFLVEPGTREMIFQVSYQASDQPQETTPDQPVETPLKRTQPSRPKFGADEFSFFNRSAITVPLKSIISMPHSQEGDQPQVLGGLMVLNKQNASFQEEDVQMISILAEQASALMQVVEMFEGAGDLFLGVIQSLTSAIDAKDPYTQGHSRRVAEYAVKIARELGLDEMHINDLRIGSLFHDIGKIGIPDAILLKNGRLSDPEMEVVRHHPALGLNILNQVKMLEPMLPAIVEHHERLDGSGYPAGLIGEQISWMGRIVAVADVYDAMTSNRPYRAGLSKQEVLAHLYNQAGIQFDLECISALDQALNRPAIDDIELPSRIAAD